MTANKIRNRIAECCTLFGFIYNQAECHVDPYYKGSNSYEYLLFCNGDEMTVHSLDEVMNTPFFNGRCLNDIADAIEITDW